MFVFVLDDTHIFGPFATAASAAAWAKAVGHAANGDVLPLLPVAIPKAAKPKARAARRR